MLLTGEQSARRYRNRAQHVSMDEGSATTVLVPLTGTAVWPK